MLFEIAEKMKEFSSDFAAENFDSLWDSQPENMISADVAVDGDYGVAGKTVAVAKALKHGSSNEIYLNVSDLCFVTSHAPHFAADEAFDVAAAAVFDAAVRVAVVVAAAVVNEFDAGYAVVWMQFQFCQWGAQRKLKLKNGTTDL